MKNALLDVAQGASNAAASTVSAPIDGIAWLLRKAGINVPTPVGGSDWMAAQGLTKQPRNALMGTIGESLGVVAPMLAAAKAPQVANALIQAEGAAKRGAFASGQHVADMTEAYMQRHGMIQPMIVYHGSKSPLSGGAFDLSRVGASTGANTEGWGAYFSESRKNAANFGKSISKLDLPDDLVSSKFLDWDKVVSDQSPEVQSAVKRLLFEYPSGYAFKIANKEANLAKQWPSHKPEYAALAEAVSRGVNPLDYIRNALPETSKLRRLTLGGFYPDEMGRDVYKRLIGPGSQREASIDLRNAGIVGQKMRASWDHHSVDPNATNFVIWDQDTLNNYVKR